MKTLIDKDEGEMAIIRCSECMKEVSDKSPMCLGCGAPTESIDPGSFSAENITENLRAGFGEVKGGSLRIWGRMIDEAERVGKAVNSLNLPSKIMTGTKELSAGSVSAIRKAFQDNLNFSRNPFGDEVKFVSKESEDRCTVFKSAVEATVDAKFVEIMAGKNDRENFLTYINGKILTNEVRGIFRSALGATPKLVEAACSLSEAILAPSAAERNNLIKSAAGIAGGAGGIGMVIVGLSAALGWGAGTVASLTAFFVGSSLVGPVGWVVSGVTLAGVAAYFAVSSSNAVATERFLKALKESTGRAIDEIWTENEEILMKMIEE